jgi:asparagine synthase (glutamine-hydrolysing)
MCGIAGIVDWAGVGGDGDSARLERALARLAPRGPDGEGRWSDGVALLGHRRLAIVDLSARGAQPMKHGDLVVVFNGMIYNYRVLRAELAALGHSFASDTDTEVLLRGWQQWGEALLPRLNGMFAFALWEQRARRLVLARDRFGKKPLLYSQHGRRLAFASDLRALEHLTGPRALDPEAVRWLFTLRYIPEPWSILAGIRKLPPGHLAEFSGGGLVVRRWHGRRPGTAPRFADEREAAEALRGCIETAVSDRLIADVPVGAFLSGGIDSAIVTACMRRSSADVRTFTVGFEGAAPYYEERPAARELARHLGTVHTEIAIDAAQTLDAIEPVFRALDEPFADSSAVPAFLIARETRKYVTVALSGDGGDEVFGGYRKYQGELLAGHYQRIPHWLRRTVIEPLARALPESKSNVALELARRIRRFVAEAGAEPAARQAGWMRLLSETDSEALLGAGAAPVRLEPLIEQLRRSAGSSDPINAMLSADLQLGLPGDMLTKIDRTSMAHALEVRCPLLDPRVVDLAAALPGSWKLARGRGKAILREAFAGMLPPQVFERPKKGFEIPIAAWLQGALRELVEQTISPRGLEPLGLRAQPVRDWWRDLQSGRRDTSERLWTVIALVRWHAQRSQAAESPPARELVSPPPA